MCGLRDRRKPGSRPELGDSGENMSRPADPRSSRDDTLLVRRPTVGKLVLALSLASWIPLLVGVYALYASSLDALDSARDFTRIVSLLTLAGVSALAGTAMLWRLVRGAGRTAAAPSARWHPDLSSLTGPQPGRRASPPRGGATCTR